MGIYASSKHAIEGLSESLDHEIRDFNVRVVLVEPTFTNTNLDVNAAVTEAPPGVYAQQLHATTRAVLAQIKSAPSATWVADQILAAIEGSYRMRQPVGKHATLLSRCGASCLPRLSTAACAKHSDLENLHKLTVTGVCLSRPSFSRWAVRRQHLCTRSIDWTKCAYALSLTTSDPENRRFRSCLSGCARTSIR